MTVWGGFVKLFDVVDDDSCYLVYYYSYCN